MNVSRAAIALLGLAVAGCDFGPKVWVEATEPQERIDAAELVRVTCETHNGSVEIVGDPTISEVVIDVHKRAGGADEDDAKAAMDDLVVVREVRGDELHLGWRWASGPDRSWGAELYFVVRQPARLSSEVKTHNAAISVREVAGACTLSAHNGAITCSGTSPSVSIGTHNGSIRCELRGVAAPVASIASHNGSVTVALDEEASVRFQCSTHNGSMSCSLPLEGEAREDGVLSGRLGSGEGELTVATHNGRIRIEPAGAAPKAEKDN